jgi:type IV secretory pathway VirB6-like protein
MKILENLFKPLENLFDSWFGQGIIFLIILAVVGFGVYLFIRLLLSYF